MKALVIGTGSIGRRHISNLLELGHKVCAYSYRGKSSIIQELHPDVILVEDWLDALQGNIDLVFVANSTEQHIEVALQAARLGKNLYIEKPLSLSLAGIEELKYLVEANHLVVETGFMLRSHPNLIWIKKYIEEGKLGELMHIRASVGQWLPDWRPDTNHRLGYSALREKGGGVIFDLIHELDLVAWLGGKIVDVAAMIRYVPLLEIQTEAIAQINLRLDSGALAQVHLDYVRPGYDRMLEVVGEKGVLSWGYSKGVVSLGESDRSVSLVHRTPQAFSRNQMFLEHMEHFLQRVAAPAIPEFSSLQDGIDALSVALACHISASERRHIHLDEVATSFDFKE